MSIKNKLIFGFSAIGLLFLTTGGLALKGGEEAS